MLLTLSAKAESFFDSRSPFGSDGESAIKQSNYTKQNLQKLLIVKFSKSKNSFSKKLSLSKNTLKNASQNFLKTHSQKNALQNLAHKKHSLKNTLSQNFYQISQLKISMNFFYRTTRAEAGLVEEPAITHAGNAKENVRPYYCSRDNPRGESSCGSRRETCCKGRASRGRGG